ncbi:HMG DNA binding protein [Clathrospora elynae]|uniref:HMG DNA binding protein n=1 Tax=Clathrospora elynae TaxID=706981 RepID=A0A6A5TEC8_9PLEO|nr:HMG DNA binding protein [Clathrospora elynae]
MNTELYLTSEPVNEVAHPDAHAVAKELFDTAYNTAYNTCHDAWLRGEDTVVLPDNIHEQFGDMLFVYFNRALTELVGESVTLTILAGDNGCHTLVQMPNIKVPHFLSQVLPRAELAQTKPSKQAPTDADAVAAGVKKAPRPMNCWIIFRDAMHKKLKIEHPNLTVQEISGLCSQIWKDLSPADKEPWQSAAQSAKEEHLRQHPDYKYSPRKPGEKKKRQSRKAKRAASVAAGPEVLNFQLDSIMTSTKTVTTTGPASVTNTVTSNVGDGFVNDFTQFSAPADFMGLFAQDSVPTDFIHDSESLRHNRLDAEFSNNFDMEMSLALFGEEALVYIPTQ